MKEFDVPIPGQSLTTEPGSRPWEQPAQFSDPDDVLEYYIPRIYAQSHKLMDLLEKGIPVVDIVHPLVMSGVMKGIHSIDTATIVAGPLSEYVAGLAESAEIDYEMGEARDSEEDAEIAKQVMAETQDEEPMEEAPPVKKGLMARPVKESV